jgi:hypothetical protein
MLFRIDGESVSEEVARFQYEQGLFVPPRRDRLDDMHLPDIGRCLPRSTARVCRKKQRAFSTSRVCSFVYERLIRGTYTFRDRRQGSVDVAYPVLGHLGVFGNQSEAGVWYSKASATDTLSTRPISSSQHYKPAQTEPSPSNNPSTSHHTT